MTTPRVPTEQLREAYARLGTYVAVAREVGLSESNVRERIRRGAASRPASMQPPAPAGAGAQHVSSGMSRDAARLRYDVPHRLSAALERFLASMQPGKIYEEQEVRRACQASKADEDYWLKLTSEHRYSQYSGYTEQGMRLWMTADDMKWALGETSEPGITGFRRA